MPAESSIYKSNPIVEEFVQSKLPLNTPPPKSKVYSPLPLGGVAPATPTSYSPSIKIAQKGLACNPVGPVGPKVHVGPVEPVGPVGPVEPLNPLNTQDNITSSPPTKAGPLLFKFKSTFKKKIGATYVTLDISTI